MKNSSLYFMLIAGLVSYHAAAQTRLTLEESKALALKNNLKIKNSALESEAARQTKKAAFTNFFPTISASGFTFEAQKDLFQMTTQGGNLPVYNGNPANLASATQFAYFPGTTTGMFKNGTVGMVTATQPIFAGGRIINGDKLASVGEDVSELQQKLSQNEVLLKTEEQYWQIVSLNEKLKTIQRYEELLNSLLRQVDDAYASGIVMRNDVLKVRVRQSELLLNKSKLENGKELAAMAFCQYIGIPYDSTLVFGDSMTIGCIPQTYYVDPGEALKKRAEYCLLRLSVEAEELRTSIKLGEYLPQVAIGAGGLFLDFDDGPGRTIGMAFGTVSIPISGWWEASHTISERKVKEEIAENNLQNNSQLLMLQMQKAWQDLTDGYKQVLLCGEEIAQAEENLKVNQDSYKNGMSAVSDLLEAQTMLQQANDQLTDAKANYRNKLVNYLQVTGR
jgi:outer membrane protein TolC